MEDIETVGVSEVCKRLGISRVTLYKRMRQNYIRPLPRDVDRDGLKLKFYLRDVERLSQLRPLIHGRATKQPSTFSLQTE